MASWQAWFYQSGYLRRRGRTPISMTSAVVGKVQVSRLLLTAAAYVPPPPPAPSNYVRPFGAVYVRYEDQAAGSLQQHLGAIPSGQQLTFPAGTFSFSDFAQASTYGILEPENVYGMAGSGIDQTILEMVPGSSTKAGSIPVQSTGSTNNFALLRIGTTTSGASRAPIVQGITLLGTDQPIDPNTGVPHTYNGLLLFYATNAVVQDSKIKGIPGNNGANPGETFSINDYRSINTLVQRVEIDGYTTAGARVAATGIGINFAQGFTVKDSLIHGMKYGHGTAFYMCTGTIEIRNVTVRDSLNPFNFERDTVTANIRNCTVQGNRSMSTTAPIQPNFAVVDSDIASSVVNIYDPILDNGAPTAANPCIVTVHANYLGVANKQLHSDIHLFVGGVERPDLLRISSNETLTPA